MTNSNIYIRICLNVKMLKVKENFFPDLTEIMATSNDANVLLWAWKGWRDISGKKMPDIYEEFVHLQNKAAKLNGWKVFIFNAFDLFYEIRKLKKLITFQIFKTSLLR